MTEQVPSDRRSGCECGKPKNHCDPCSTDSLPKDELSMLRKRVTNQRKELRRLNSQLQSFWHGWAYHGHIVRELDYRRKMINAFGADAVCHAEKQS